MQITLVQGLALALMAFLTAFDNRWEFFMLDRPLPMAAFTGLILGDPVTGCMVGALVELAFTGLMPVGGASVPHGTLAGIMSAVLAITQGLSPMEALPLSLPFAYLMQYVQLLRATLLTLMNPGAERIAATGNVKKLVRYHFLTAGMLATVWAIVTFMCTYAAQNLIGAFVEAIPTQVISGMRLAGGLMPAVGFCMMLSIIFKKELSPFLIFGFVISILVPTGNALPITLIGLSLALFYYFFLMKGNKEEGSEQHEGI